MVKSDLRHSIQCQASSDELRGIQDMQTRKVISPVNFPGWKEIHQFSKWGMLMHIDE